jgi:nucleotide-binding universal stress UspA family protein
MRVRRIVVGLDSRLRTDAALEALAALADEMEADLIGLFVEDVDLLHFAALPFAREVGFPSATRRDLDVARMERSFEAQANELRRACEAVLKSSSVSWSFRVARGSRAEQLLSVATEAAAPTLLVPPGTDPRAEPAIVSQSELTEKSLRELLDNAQRPILILP